MSESEAPNSNPAPTPENKPAPAKAAKWFSGMVGSYGRKPKAANPPAPEPAPVADPPITASAPEPATAPEPASAVESPALPDLEADTMAVPAEAPAAEVAAAIATPAPAPTAETPAAETPAEEAPAEPKKGWLSGWMGGGKKETEPAPPEEPAPSPAASVSPAEPAPPAADVAASVATPAPAAEAPIAEPPTSEKPAEEAPAESRKGWLSGWMGGGKKDAEPPPATEPAAAVAAPPAEPAASAPDVAAPADTTAPTAETPVAESPVAEKPAEDAPAEPKKGWLSGWMGGGKADSETPVAAEPAPTPAPAEPAPPAPDVAAATATPTPTAESPVAEPASAELAPVPTQPPTPDLDAAAAGIVADVRAFWRFLRRALIVGATITVVVAFLEIVNLGRIFYWIHPVFGTTFFLLLFGAAAALVGKAAYRYITTPQALLPPAMPQKPEETGLAELRQQTAFVERYLHGLSRNPEMSARLAEVEATRGKAQALSARLAEPTAVASAELRDQVRALTDQEVPRLLTDLDAKVDEMVWREALAVGIGTAISPNGMLDAFIVLWRNLNLVSRISRVYFGRPGLLGTLVIARDVAGSILVASYLESVADAAGSLIGAQLGSLAGSVAGPMMEGMTNALVTVRVGCLARDRCRSFRRWDQATRQGALKSVAAYTKQISGKLWKEILAASGLGLGKLGEKLKGGLAAGGKAIGSGVGKLFGRRKNDAEPAEGVEGAEGAEGTAPA